MNEEIKSKILAAFVLVEEGDLTPIKAQRQIINILQEGNEKLTFGDLERGDKFIAFPTPGDNSGHGGYKGGHVLYFKWPLIEGGFCGKNFSHGTFSDFPDSMEVIKII